MSSNHPASSGDSDQFSHRSNLVIAEGLSNQSADSSNVDADVAIFPSVSSIATETATTVAVVSTLGVFQITMILLSVFDIFLST